MEHAESPRLKRYALQFRGKEAQMDEVASKVAAAVLQLQNNDGMITTEAVVQAARDPQSPLHPYFEWDDATAVEHYRKGQASKLLGDCVLIRKEEEK